MSIKINRAKKIATCGRYPHTWAAVINRIPASIIDGINSRQLADLADAMWHQYQAGEAAA